MTEAELFTETIKDEIIEDFTLRFIIDDVLDGKEFRCSIYDRENNLVSDGFGDTPKQATMNAMEEVE